MIEVFDLSKNFGQFNALKNINLKVENTFIIYKHRNIVDKYIDLKPTNENFIMLSNTLDKTQGKYFDLPEPKYN